MLKKTSTVVFIKLGHVLRLDKLFFAVFHGLLLDLVETSIGGQKFPFEVELNVDITAIVFSYEIAQVKCISHM